MMDIKLDYSMSYEEWKQCDKTEVLDLIDLIDVLQEIVDEVEDD